MGLQKGRTNNPNGRPPGIPNKITKELREALKAIVENELDRLPGFIEKLEASERVELLIKLLPYVIPKPEPVNFSFGEKDIFDEFYEDAKKASTAQVRHGE